MFFIILLFLKISVETRPLMAAIPQQQLQQQQHQQTHERYIPPPLEILPEHQEQPQQQQYSTTNLHNYHANVFTTPGAVTTTGTVAAPTTSAAFQEPQHVGDVATTTTSTNGIFENGKVCTIENEIFNLFLFFSYFVIQLSLIGSIYKTVL